MNRQTIKKFLSENGKKGGTKTLERHGVDHYKRMAQKAVEKRNKIKTL